MSDHKPSVGDRVTVKRWAGIWTVTNVSESTADIEKLTDDGSKCWLDGMSFDELTLVSPAPYRKGNKVMVKNYPGVWTVDWVGSRTADLLQSVNGGVKHLNGVLFEAMTHAPNSSESEPESECPPAAVKPTPEPESPVAEAVRIFHGDREDDYGENTAPAIAQAWSAYLGVDIDGRDVCWMMLQLKAIRDKYSTKRDNQVDAHGYLLLMERNPRAERR